jgi:DNA-binding transcriptional MerR regulator
MLDQDPNKHTIQDLEKKTGVPERTIRYYQKQGLLQEPTRGKPAIYNDEHLVRLLLIKEMKKSYLPLDEIKKKFDTLNYQAAKDLLEKLQAGLPEKGLRGQTSKERATLSESESVLEYISRVRQQQSEIQDQDVSKFKTMQYQYGPTPNIEGAPVESWQHILLSPGIEIQIKEPLSPWDKKRLEELIRQARKIFT